MSAHRDDGSELGAQDIFANPPTDNGSRPASRPVAGAHGGARAHGLTRDQPVAGGRGWGRGPIPVDERKFRYDVMRAKSVAPVAFSVSKADRMTADEAGDLLHRIHQTLGIDTAEEQRILAFDRALWFEHTINGASMMQPGRGQFIVDGLSLDMNLVKGFFGENQRRFFRAFADDIAEANRDVLDAFDPFDPGSAEKVGQLRQVAAERGLHKYPHLAHDSSDACVTISLEERMAVIASKRIVIASVSNKVDQFPGRVPEGLGRASGQVPVAVGD